MKQISQDWEEMMAENFNPVPLSLQLLDDNLLGKDCKRGIQGYTGEIGSFVKRKTFSNGIQVVIGIHPHLGKKGDDGN
ncbi:14615_t:CDS:2, partial [Acaulospora colombiana]